MNNPKGLQGQLVAGQFVAENSSRTIRRRTVLGVESRGRLRGRHFSKNVHFLFTLVKHFRMIFLRKSSLILLFLFIYHKLICFHLFLLVFHFFTQFQAPPGPLSENGAPGQRIPLNPSNRPWGQFVGDSSSRTTRRKIY